MTLFAWSSQAAGFFTGRYRENDRESTLATRETARVWFNPGNFQRLQRVRELAALRAVTPNQVALAYVLCELENAHALVGPETVEELRQSFETLALNLSTAERRWLNLESEVAPSI